MASREEESSTTNLNLLWSMVVAELKRATPQETSRPIRPARSAATASALVTLQFSSRRQLDLEMETEKNTLIVEGMRRNAEYAAGTLEVLLRDISLFGLQIDVDSYNSAQSNIERTQAALARASAAIDDILLQSNVVDEPEVSPVTEAVIPPRTERTPSLPVMRDRLLDWLGLTGKQLAPLLGLTHPTLYKLEEKQSPQQRTTNALRSAYELTSAYVESHGARGVLWLRSRGSELFKKDPREFEDELQRRIFQHTPTELPEEAPSTFVPRTPRNYSDITLRRF